MAWTDCGTALSPLFSANYYEDWYTQAATLVLYILGSLTTGGRASSGETFLFFTILALSSFMIVIQEIWRLKFAS